MNKATLFRNKATEIIRESIKSVVYIDEKAWNPFEGAKYNSSINEHIISKKLYKNLKQKGINLNIHKFQPGEEELPIDNPLKKYLFNDIDLVLLDWDLDDNELNTTALKLLNDIVVQPHIHFCCVYSATPTFDDIIKKISSYFSGYSNEQYEEIRAIFEDNDEIINLLNPIDITSMPDGRIAGNIMRIDRTIFERVTKITQLNNAQSLIPMAISINNNLPKSDKSLNYPFEIISEVDSEFTLIINNTVISILSKRKNKPENFITNFSNHVAKDKSRSFFKLLGLDMQNQFSRYGAFINPEILNISFNTFMHHRQQIGLSGVKPSFDDFIKDLFLENSKLNLVSADLKLLKNNFLNEFKVVKKELTDKELALINCFYNGVKLDGLRPINFGDIFFDDFSKSYYLCITPLCDCVIRNGSSNTNFKYYFVKGSKINVSEGLKKGDGGFISYISEKECISWAPGEYVKPFQFHIPNPIIENDQINIFDWIEEYHLTAPLNYVFTLKQNYTQRIANHAFAHPVRVGVDFVKK